MSKNVTNNIAIAIKNNACEMLQIKEKREDHNLLEIARHKSEL